MNNTLLGIAVAAVVFGAQVASAQDCGPQPSYAPAGQNFQSGRYELQTVQQWVPGGQQQVWVEGTCQQGGGRGRWGRGGGRQWQQRCTQGSYRTVYTAGHYETRQTWVWVAHQYAPPPPRQYNPYQNSYGPRGGVRVRGGNGHVAVSVY